MSGSSRRAVEVARGAVLVVAAVWLSACWGASRWQHEDDAAACVPACEGRLCGDDGCGGECGPGCPEGERCVDEGRGCACEPGCDGGPCEPGQWATVCAGTFVMGSPPDEWGRDASLPWEETPHEVTITRHFEVRSTEVSREEVVARLGITPRWDGDVRDDPCPQCAASTLSFQIARAYCNVLSEEEGLPACYVCRFWEPAEPRLEGGYECDLDDAYESPFECPGYRLPTEAEWELAARAGTAGQTYAGPIATELRECEVPADWAAEHCGHCGLPDPVLDGIAWYCDNRVHDLETWGVPPASGPMEPGLLEPSPWGLYDLLGNAWEWTEDSMCPYPAGSVEDPWCDEPSVGRMVRGGSWDSPARFVRSAAREAFYTTARAGIRLVRTLDP